MPWADLGAGDWSQAVLWRLEGEGRTSKFHEKAGWFRDEALKVEEIPEGNPVKQIRFRVALV
jgi:hypothetical protein